MEEGLTNRQLLSQGIDKEVERLGIQRLTKAEQAKLHYDWQVHGDQEAYQKLYLYSMRLVYKIVNKLERLGMLGSYSGMRGSGYEDAISNGAIGISEGLDRWNPNMSSLTSYVWIAIRRNVLNSNRKDWSKGLTGNYYENKNPPPVNWDPHHVFQNGSDHQPTAFAAADRHPDWETQNECLEGAIHMELSDFVREKLTPIQQKVIKLLYVEDMTQAEAGLIIGRTQQRVDQIHREALEVLRSIYL